MGNNINRYLTTIVISILFVNAFACLQYCVIQDIAFSIANYIIPSIVGGVFGFLLAYIKVLEKKYHQEKDLVEEKNKKIHKYIGTIVHDLRSPISAIYSLVEILMDPQNNKDEENPIIHVRTWQPQKAIDDGADHFQFGNFVFVQ